MTLEFYEYERGVARNRIVECLACGYEFDKHERRWTHFLEDHGPEDFGLSPLGETRDDPSTYAFERDRNLLERLAEEQGQELYPNADPDPAITDGGYGGASR